MFRFPDIAENQGQNENVTEKIIFDRKEANENKNNTETIYTSVVVPMNMHTTA